MRTNLPKTLDQLIFCKYLVNFLKSTKYLVNVHKFTKCLAYSYHQKGVNTTFLLIETKLHQFCKFILIVYSRLPNKHTGYSYYFLDFFSGATLLNREGNAFFFKISSV